MSPVDLSKLHQNDEEYAAIGLTEIDGLPAEPPAACERQAPLAPDSGITDLPVAANGLADLREQGLRRREVFLGIGGSLGFHATALLLAIWVGFLGVPRGGSGPRYLTVNLAGLAGTGDGLPGSGGGRTDAAAGSATGPSATTVKKACTAKPLSEKGVSPNSSRDASLSVPKKPQSSPRIADHKNVARPVSKPKQPVPVPHSKTRSKKRTKAAHTRRAVTRSRHATASHEAKRLTQRVSATAPEASSSSPRLMPEGKSGSIRKPPATPGAGSGAAGTGATGRGRGPAEGGGGTGGSGGSGGFNLNQLDTVPSVIHQVRPVYPQAAQRMDITGRVVLKFLVKADGSVSKATVIESRPRGVFERAALEAVRQWRFRPGRYRGRAVATWVVLPIRFRLSRQPE